MVRNLYDQSQILCLEVIQYAPQSVYVCHTRITQCLFPFVSPLQCQFAVALPLNFLMSLIGGYECIHNSIYAFTVSICSAFNCFVSILLSFNTLLLTHASFINRPLQLQKINFIDNRHFAKLYKYIQHKEPKLN